MQWASSQEREERLGSLVRTRCQYTLFFFRSLFLFILAAMGATFAFTDAFVANQRQKDDAFNGAVAGCAAGFLAGIKSTCRNLFFV